MKVSFSNARMRKLCNSEKRLRAEFGARMAALIGQRLLELQAVETLAELRKLPGPRCHELSGQLNGYLAVGLAPPQRLVFKPDHRPVPKLNEGGLDWANVTAVEVFRIGDYH